MQIGRSAEESHDDHGEAEHEDTSGTGLAQHGSAK
jgi:hypothetical protein